jgi:hypothetical protein
MGNDDAERIGFERRVLLSTNAFDAGIVPVVVYLRVRDQVPSLEQVDSMVAKCICNDSKVRTISAFL